MSADANDPGLDTPLAPLPDSPAEAAPAPRPKRRGKAKSRKPRTRTPSAPGTARAAVRIGLGQAVRSWRVLLFILFVQLALALTVVLPFWSSIAPHVDHNPHATALAGSPNAYDRALGWEAGMNPGIWRDIKRVKADAFSTLTITHFWIAFVAWLFGALVAGGVLGTAASQERPIRVGSFIAAGGRNYGKMLRVGLVFALAYYLCGRLIFEVWGTSVKSDEFMEPSEGAGWWGDRIRAGVFVLLFLWFRVAADLARADLVVSARTSAFGAFLRGLGRALRRTPLATALFIGVPGFLLLLVFALLAHALVGGGWLVLVLLFLVFELALLVRWASRIAVLGGLAHLARPRV